MNIDNIVKKIDSKLILEIAKNIVEMDSQNPPGKCDHIAKYLAEKGKSLGFKAEIFAMDDLRYNVVLSFGKGDKDIIVSGHLDTVPVGDETKWKYPPLEMTEVDGKLFGRGTVDMKGGVASLIAVMEAIYQSDIDLDRRIVFAGTADEEVGMNGAFHLKEKGVMDKADCVIITEATDLKVGISEKGPTWIRVNVKGKAAHGSMPEEGVNAILGACKVMNKLTSNLPKERNPLLDLTTLNVGMIEGGSKINVVPEVCYFDCDYRLVPEVKYDSFLKSIDKLVEEINKKNDFIVTTEVLHVVPAVETKQSEPIVQSMLKWAGKITGKKTDPIGLTYGTDAAALIPPKYIPFIILGGGYPSVLHQTNEFVHLSDLVKAAEIITGGILDTYKPNK
jgi:succinyl-diaminopimelate desuccinylase